MSWGARSSGLGESLLSDWHRVLRLVIVRGGGHGHMRPIARCSGGDGLTCREPMPQIVADVSPRWGGRASIGAIELRPPRSKTVARQTGQTPPQHSQDHHGERAGHYEHEACGTEARQRPLDSPPFEAEQRNHSGRHHLPDGVMSRCCRDARFSGGYLGPVGRAGGTVTPRNS